MSNRWEQDGDAIIKNGYIIYPAGDAGFHGQDCKDFNSRIVDERKIAKFYNRDGFMSLEDCAEYADKYFRI